MNSTGAGPAALPRDRQDPAGGGIDPGLDDDARREREGEHPERLAVERERASRLHLRAARGEERGRSMRAACRIIEVSSGPSTWPRRHRARRRARGSPLPSPGRRPRRGAVRDGRRGRCGPGRPGGERGICPRARSALRARLPPRRCTPRRSGGRARHRPSPRRDARSSSRGRGSRAAPGARASSGGSGSRRAGGRAGVRASGP